MRYFLLFFRLRCQNRSNRVPYNKLFGKLTFLCYPSSCLPSLSLPRPLLPPSSPLAIRLSLKPYDLSLKTTTLTPARAPFEPRAVVWGRLSTRAASRSCSAFGRFQVGHGC